MKTFLLSTLATILAGLTVTTAAYAQYNPVGADGISASPKLRQVLNAQRPVSAPIATRAMSCDQCADILSPRLSQHAKGAEVPTAARQVTASHGCGSCETRITMAGQGKARHQVAAHQCAMQMPSTPSCCAAK